MKLDSTRLAQAAEKERENCAQFLRDMCRIPAVSNQEGPVVKRIQEEMEKVGFDEVKVDGYGSILGRIGNGPRVIAIDSHIDTVGVGDRSEWKWDPHEGKYEKGVIWARGASDQRGGMASMVYAGKVIKELGLAADCSVWMVGSVCEEDSDGIAWLYILRENVIQPDFVIVSEPTNLRIYRGHRGRMEIKVKVPGKSCHGSAPERGVNPVYKALPFIREIEKLNPKLGKHKFLGKGTITLTQIREEGPSQCAVPGALVMHLDRRLEPQATKESAIAEVKKCLKSAKIKDAKVWLPVYDQPSWKGTVYPMEQYYPGWCLDEDHSLVRCSVDTYRAVYGRKPVVDKWVFSTNATAITGLCGVPSIGFGPGAEDNAHSVVEHMPVDDLVAAIQFYAAFPAMYSQSGGLAAHERKYAPKRGK